MDPAFTALLADLRAGNLDAAPILADLAGEINHPRAASIREAADSIRFSESFCDVFVAVAQIAALLESD